MKLVASIYTCFVVVPLFIGLLLTIALMLPPVVIGMLKGK